MEVHEDKTQSFIVKIWLEQTAVVSGQAIWRGHITHVPSGVRRHVQSKDDLIEFIDVYLAEMGVETDGK